MSKTGPYLTTFVQEKGRLCRYTTLNKTLPVMYLSEALLEDITKNLKQDCSYYNLFVNLSVKLLRKFSFRYNATLSRITISSNVIEQK